MRIRIKPTDKVPLELSSSERQLLIDNVIGPPNLLKKITVAPLKDGKPKFYFTLDELEELAGFIAAEANHTIDKKYGNKLDKIFLRINKIMDSYTDQEEEPVEDTDDLVGQILGGKPTNNDPWLGIDSSLAKFAETPQSEMGGLSPIQVQFLVQSNWNDPNGAIKFNENLTLDQLQEATLFKNTRTMLSAIAKADGVKLTKRGNLSRSFVKEMLDVLEISEGARDRLFFFNKVINELDCFEAHIPRILLDMAGLVRKYKETFKVSKKGKELLDDSKVGELFNLLFHTFFRKFNLFYLSRLQEIQGHQATIAFPIYMSGQLCSDWIKPETIAHKVLLSTILERIPEHKTSKFVESLVYSTVVEPLVGFGLLADRELPKGDNMYPPVEVRKTPVFDEFLKFDLDLPTGLNQTSPKKTLH